jgi:hypothetical protein
MLSATSRAWAPSCRSRSIRRSSAACSSTAPRRVRVSSSTRSVSSRSRTRPVRWARNTTSARIAVAVQVTAAGYSGQNAPPPDRTHEATWTAVRITVREPTIATARTPAGSSPSAQRSAACTATAAPSPVQTQPGQNVPPPVPAQTIVTTSPRTAEIAAWRTKAARPSTGAGSAVGMLVR